jgi:hypothetical protein
MPRKTSQRESVSPSLPPLRAIELLRTQIGMIERIEHLSSDDPEIKKWELTTENILNATFGMPDGDKHHNTKEFAYASGGPLRIGMSPREQQIYHQRQTQNRKAVLESIIQQLELSLRPLKLHLVNIGFIRKLSASAVSFCATAITNRRLSKHISV